MFEIFNFFLNSKTSQNGLKRRQMYQFVEKYKKNSSLQQFIAKFSQMFEICKMFFNIAKSSKLNLKWPKLT